MLDALKALWRGEMNLIAQKNEAVPRGALRC